MGKIEAVDAESWEPTPCFRIQVDFVPAARLYWARLIGQALYAAGETELEALHGLLRHLGVWGAEEQRTQARIVAARASQEEIEP